jgi:hypothetical protein
VTPPAVVRIADLADLDACVVLARQAAARPPQAWRQALLDDLERPDPAARGRRTVACGCSNPNRTHRPTRHHAATTSPASSSIPPTDAKDSARR